MDDLEDLKRKKMFELMRKAAEQESKKNYPTKPVEVTDATFYNFIKQYPVVVVDCWAPWCGPCRMISPVIEELASDYAGKVVFGKLNVDENPAVAAEYGIMSIPTLLFARNGEVVDRLIGAAPRQIIEAKLRQILA
ncbi:MAG: thioredoxin [Thaumarchaeota archaeon]|nr:thioredoxin [Nitrososphaerota archaeon]